MKMNKQKEITELEYDSSLWPKIFNSPQKYYLILWYSYTCSLYGFSTKVLQQPTFKYDAQKLA